MPYQHEIKTDQIYCLIVNYISYCEVYSISVHPASSFDFPFPWTTLQLGCTFLLQESHLPANCSSKPNEAYLNKPISGFRVVKNFQVCVLELNSTGKWPSRSRFGHPWCKAQIKETNHHYGDFKLTIIFNKTLLKQQNNNAKTFTRAKPLLIHNENFSTRMIEIKAN